MNIITVEKSCCEIIETDGAEWPTYRRYSSGIWEQLMGESWEPCYLNGDQLEEMYIKHMFKYVYNRRRQFRDLIPPTPVPLPPEPPPVRIIREGFSDLCSQCGSSRYPSWYRLFGKRGCIRPDCKSHGDKNVR